MALPEQAHSEIPQSSDLTGKMIGRFAVRARLGAGGMGEVYRADDTKLKRTVALKRVSPKLRSIPRYTDRLLHEAQLASGFNNPNIAAIYDTFEEGGEIYLVMEFVKGETLRRRLARPIPLDEVMGITVQCAGAIAAAEKLGIVHGDIKPENIMLTPDGQVKILDFGVAKRLVRGEIDSTLDSVFASGGLSGTPAYMAPEVLEAKDPDTRADIFALGVVFYESLTGLNPFQAGSFIKIASRIMQEDPEPISEVCPKLPADFDHIVGKMLEKDPADRYATAADLCVDLRALQRTTDSGTKLTPPGRAVRAKTHPTLQEQILHVQKRGRLMWLLLIPVVMAFMLLAAAVFFRWPSEFFGGTGGGSARPIIRSLAVLPLKNISGDAAQEYFADGMTDALTTELASIGSLRVISRTSAMLYKSGQKTVPQIAKELHVDALIEGSVMRVGDQVQISATLIQASPEREVWTQRYTRDLRDVLSLQSDVAQKVASGINASLTEKEQARLTGQHGSIDPASYENYLRGLAEYNKRTDAGLQQSIQFFRESVQKDPRYAPAYAGLADSWAALANNFILSPKEALTQAAFAAKKAVDLDSTLSEAHAARAWVNVSSLIFTGAEDDFKKAIELDPNNARAHHHYGLYLAALGRKEDSLSEMEKAQELDPLSLIISANIAWCQFLGRDFEKAIDQAKSTLTMDPNFAVAHEYLGQAYTEKKQYPEALAEFRKAMELANNDAGFQTDLAYGLAISGNREEAQKMLRALTAAAEKSYVSPYDMAIINAGLGQRTVALNWLAKALDERSGRLINLNVHPWLDSVRSDPKFKEILQRVGITNVAASH
jgi:eukaryotic-like serine/threonine-protein kinase